MARIYRYFFLLLSGIALNSSAFTQMDPVMERIVEIGRTDNRTMEHLDVLCNRIGGRLIGSDAFENAAIWAASKFDEWGMEVVMDEVGELPVGFNRGPWFGKMLGENGMILHFATPSYTSGTKGVQRGHVLIEPKTQAEFDRMKGSWGSSSHPRCPSGFWPTARTCGTGPLRRFQPYRISNWTNTSIS